MAGDKNPFAKFLTHFEKGRVLFREGDRGEDMYIVQSGKVAIKKKLAEGETTLAVLEKGDFFGEMAILERMPRSASAEVIEDGDLIVIAGDMFGDMIKSNPEIAVLQGYLPAQASESEIDAMIAEAIAATGAAGPAGIGKVMAIVKPKLAGRADIGAVSAKVKAKLA